MRCEWGKAVAAFVLLLMIISVLCGCSGNERPRMRFGAFFGSPTGMKFPHPDDLDKHNYKSTRGETNGMVYTCKGGFIDLGHVRESADRTAHLTKVTYQNIIQNKTQFSFRSIEPTQYHVKLSYPTNWNSLPKTEKERIADEISLSLGQYFAHNTLIWHETITWYGFATLGIFPDKISSFSAEDSYSDLLGTHLGVRALRQKNTEYNQAMTKLLYQALKQLDVQPADTARNAAEKVHGKWYSGGMYFMVNMKKRNFDVGLDDGFITPWLVDGICPNTIPQLCSSPSLVALAHHGFGMQLELEPRIMEKRKIYHDIGLDKSSRINPTVHFPKIIEQIEKEFQ